MHYTALMPPDRSDFVLGDLPDPFSPEAMSLLFFQVTSEATDYRADYADALLGVEPGVLYERTVVASLVDFTL
jgi:hypothetical protein